jgi:hypothetical protein
MKRLGSRDLNIDSYKDFAPREHSQRFAERAKNFRMSERLSLSATPVYLSPTDSDR